MSSSNFDPNLPLSLNNFHNIQASYFNLMQNQVNEMVTLTFEADLNGKILLKPYQCHQCLGLCHFEQVYKTHILNCVIFSCPYLECRDLTYQNIYRTDKMFENKGNMLSHIVENHDREKMAKFNKEGDLTLNCDEKDVRTDGNRYALENDIVEIREKEWEQSRKIKEYEAKISLLESINIKLVEENVQTKDINSNLFLTNLELKKKLIEKDKNVCSLLQTIQTNIANFKKDDSDQCNNTDVVSSVLSKMDYNEKHSNAISHTKPPLDSTEKENIQKEKNKTTIDSDSYNIIDINAISQTAKEENDKEKIISDPNLDICSLASSEVDFNQKYFQWRESDNILDENEGSLCKNNELCSCNKCSQSFTLSSEQQIQIKIEMMGGEINKNVESLDCKGTENQHVDSIEDLKDFKENFSVDHKNTNSMKESFETISSSFADHPCNHCDTNSETALDLSIHAIPIPCVFCDITSPCITTWRDHLKENHPRPPRHQHGATKFTCPSCSNYSGMRSKVIRHIETWHGGKVYSCFSNNCGVSYSTRELLVRRIESTHVDKAVKREKFQSVECEVCNKVLVNKGIYLNHIKLQHKQSQTFECGWCGKTFKNKRYMTDHEKRMHLETTKVTCDVCGMKVTKLDDHMIRKHPENLDSEKLVDLQCQYCEFQTKIRRSLQKHIQRVHQEKTIQCEKCPFIASMNCFLNVHMKRAHGDQRFHCTFEGCNKYFFIEKELMHHVRQTHPDGVFDCDKCGKRFLNQSKWTRHMKYHSLDREGFPCNICTKRFISKQKVAEHMNVHTGKMPFKCRVDGCQKAFSTSSALSHHVKNCTNRRNVMFNL